MSVCAEPGCPTLTSTRYCLTHTRPAWHGSNRDRAAHARFARAVKTRAKGRCERCRKPSPRLEAHHLTPGKHDPANGIALCNDCHRAIDPHARRAPR